MDKVQIIGMNAGEQHVYAFKSIGIKCHNQLEFPFIPGRRREVAMFRVIQQRAATFISFHQTLFTTPTCAPHQQSSCHTKLLPAGSEGEDGWQRCAVRTKSNVGKGKRERKRERQDESGSGRLFLIC